MQRQAAGLSAALPSFRSPTYAHPTCISLKFGQKFGQTGPPQFPFWGDVLALRIPGFTDVTNPMTHALPSDPPSFSSPSSSDLKGVVNNHAHGESTDAVPG